MKHATAAPARISRAASSSDVPTRSMPGRKAFDAIRARSNHNVIRAGRSYSRLLRGSGRWIAVSLGLALAQSALIVPIGLLFRDAFDRTIPENRVGTLVATGGLIVALSLGSTALGLWTRNVVLAATKSAVASLRVALLERIQGLPASWFDRREADQLHSVIVQDTERVDLMSNVLAGALIPAAIITIALSAGLVVVNPLLFLLLTPTIAAMALLTRWLGGILGRRTRAWQRALDQFSIRTQFALRARSLVAAQGTEELELTAARAETEALSDAGRSLAWVQTAYSQLNGAVAMLAAVVVLVVGGAAVARGSMTVGSLISFYALVALLRTQANTVLITIPEVISGAESLARLEDILDVRERSPYRGTRDPVRPGQIVLRDVHFSYDEAAPLLQGVSLDIEPGERIAIVGPNGAGKTTIAALILGLYRPTHGVLLANGVPYDELDIRALRRRMAIVPQDPIFFHGSIADNIAYGDPAADLVRVRAAAEMATADDFISTLPAGYDTEVGAEGALLSGGDRQRVAIARALLRNPSLLILDEPTNSLDRESVTALLERLGELSRDSAILLISHDPIVVAEAERVYALEGGVGQLLGAETR